MCLALLSAFCWRLLRACCRSSSSIVIYNLRQEFMRGPDLHYPEEDRGPCGIGPPFLPSLSSPPPIAAFSTSPPSEAGRAAACGEERSIPGDWLTSARGTQCGGAQGYPVCLTFSSRAGHSASRPLVQFSTGPRSRMVTCVVVVVALLVACATVFCCDAFNY